MASEILAATEINLKDVNQTNCDREPIHIPNLIQPHGVLMAVSAAEYQILQVSLNTKQMLGIEPQELLDCPLTELLGAEQVAAIKSCLAKDFDNINPIPIKLTNLDFNGIVHRNGEIIILELEPSEPEQEVDFFNFYRLVKSPVNKIQSTVTLNELCSAVAEEVKKITQFDRVMVYRFEPEGSGTVIAETAETELNSFLGLRYPATDIPQPARQLFISKSLRLIPDVGYQAVGITPEVNPLTKERLDMSMTDLRNVSPFHIEYLTNMGVGATLVISLVKNKQLWGLISCHHSSPRYIPYEIRAVCEFIGQVASFELAAKEESQDLDYKIKLKSIQSQLLKLISGTEDLKLALGENHDLLLDLTGSSGVALVLGTEITLIGETPEAEFIESMFPWLENQFGEKLIYHTNSWGQVYEPAQAYREVASGLLSILVSKVQKIFLIWFRPEVTQTVNWAGNPNQPVEVEADGTLKLTPRNSFALWQEIVQLQSLPWKLCEREAALELRGSIVDIVLSKADELTQINRELARSNTELDAFAYIASHDLKEPLRGIYNYSSFLIEDYGEILDEDGADKLNTLMRLTHRMEDLINSLLHYSRLGRAELVVRPINLNDLVAGVLDVIQASARDAQVQFNIPRPLPTIECDRTQVNELFTNLISNGIKYNQKAEKVIEIGYLDTDHPVVMQKMSGYPEYTPTKIVFYVRDNGIGIRDRHLESIFRIFKRLHGQKKYGGGTGAGLTIAKKIVERHGGEIWVESIYQEGSTFYFTLQ
ncbi:MAG: ATP-binding protein [Cyanobacteria bacterium P01_G01_bin.39]